MLKSSNGFVCCLAKGDDDKSVISLNSRKINVSIQLVITNASYNCINNQSNSSLSGGIPPPPSPKDKKILESWCLGKKEKKN